MPEPFRSSASIACVYALVVAFFGVAGPAAAQQPVPEKLTTVEVSTLGGITDAGLYLADAYGFFKQAGIVADMQRFGTTSEQVAAIATGQTDVGGVAVTAGLFAAAQRGIALHIVGDKQSIRPGFSTTRLVVRPSEYKTDENDTALALRGKTLAGPARASFGTFVTSEFLKHHGMTIADVKYIELPFPDMIPALSNGAIDGATIIEPFLSLALQAGAAKLLADPTSFFPDGASVVPLVYSEKFANTRPIAQAFMTAYMQGVRVYNDAFVKGRDKEKVIDIIAARAKVSPALIAASYLPGLDPDQRVNKSFLAAAQTFFIEQGMQKGSADIDKLVDPSFAENAVQKLGPYH